MDRREIVERLARELSEWKDYGDSEQAAAHAIVEAIESVLRLAVPAPQEPQV